MPATGCYSLAGWRLLRQLEQATFKTQTVCMPELPEYVTFELELSGCQGPVIENHGYTAGQFLTIRVMESVQELLQHALQSWTVYTFAALSVAIIFFAYQEWTKSTPKVAIQVPGRPTILFVGPMGSGKTSLFGRVSTTAAQVAGDVLKACYASSHTGYVRLLTHQ